MYFYWKLIRRFFFSSISKNLLNAEQNRNHIPQSARCLFGISLSTSFYISKYTRCVLRLNTFNLFYNFHGGFKDLFFSTYADRLATTLLSRFFNFSIASSNADGDKQILSIESGFSNGWRAISNNKSSGNRCINYNKYMSSIYIK